MLASLKEHAAAEAAASRAKAETSKLWEVARKTLEAPRFQSLKRQSDLQRAIAEVELEESMQAESWKLFHGSLDKKVLGEITRMAAGCVPGQLNSMLPYSIQLSISCILPDPLRNFFWRVPV